MPDTAHNTAHTAQPPSSSSSEEKKGGEAVREGSTVRCTAENVAEFRSFVKGWPEMVALIADLQKQHLFPGLRAVQITPRGTPKQIANTLASLTASKR